MLALRHRFEATDKRHRIEAEQRRGREALRNRQAREKREEMEDRAEEALSAFASAVLLSAPAPPERIAAFEATLTNYDVAVVKALMRNEELMDLVTADIDAMLGRAHVLEDGRRVFRTEDGTQVFDEFGAEVSDSVIAPDLIDPAAPTWEAFSAKLAERDALVQERQDILEYQKKLDTARVEIEGGEISLDELEAMEADLMESMPPAVAAHVEGLDPGDVDAELAAATPPAHGPTSSGSLITERVAAMQAPTFP
ncbi:hypothetical protein [Halovulum sp. GXIMD14793]